MAENNLGRVIECLKKRFLSVKNLLKNSNFLNNFLITVVPLLSTRLNLSDLPSVGKKVRETALKISQQFGYTTHHEL